MAGLWCFLHDRKAVFLFVVHNGPIHSLQETFIMRMRMQWFLSIPWHSKRPDSGFFSWLTSSLPLCGPQWTHSVSMRDFYNDNEDAMIFSPFPNSNTLIDWTHDFCFVVYLKITALMIFSLCGPWWTDIVYIRITDVLNSAPFIVTLFILSFFCSPP